MSLAEDAAATYNDESLTDEERSDAFEAYRSIGLAAITLPFVIGDRTITSLDWDGSLLSIDGEGDIDWPVRVVHLPFLVPDDAGLIVHEEHSYTFDVAAVITEIVSAL